MTSLSFNRHGDKENSEFFEHYLQELLTERDRVGLTDMIGQIEALMITVDPEHSVRYVGELCLMTPYHYLVTLESESHWTHVLRIDMASPDLLVSEVKDPCHPRHLPKPERGLPHRRQQAEQPLYGRNPARGRHDVLSAASNSADSAFSPRTIFAVLNSRATWRSVNPPPIRTTSSPTWSVRRTNFGFIHWVLIEIRSDVQEVYAAAKELQEQIGIDDLILPIDHLATRIYCQNREVAILEWLSLSSYYYWGSYDIKDQNSSTNVTKIVHFHDEIHSPAKVFTANNTPYFVNHLENLPSPTETFVRNYGPRLHHIAMGVRDGEHHGTENIKYVVDAIARQGRIPAGRDRVKRGRDQADLLRCFGTLLPDYGICSALR